MRHFKIISISVVFLILCGCSIPNLGYFQVHPYAKPFFNKVDMPINLVLMKGVKDSFVVEGVQASPMIVTDFRKSFKQSMKNTLEKNFESIRVSDVIPDTGLSLIIYRVKPFWTLTDQTEDGGEHSVSISYISSAFRVVSSLVLDREIVETASFTVYSDNQMSARGQAHCVFKGCLIQSCEKINSKIFNPKVIEKLAHK